MDDFYAASLSTVMDGPPPRHFFGGLREPLGQRVARGDQRSAVISCLRAATSPTARRLTYTASETAPRSAAGPESSAESRARLRRASCRSGVQER